MLPVRASLFLPRPAGLTLTTGFSVITEHASNQSTMKANPQEQAAPPLKVVIHPIVWQNDKSIPWTRPSD
jgi:hypothetical protein